MRRMSADVPLCDQVRFAAEYRRLLPTARRTAFAVLRDDGAADDVAQEVFAALWERPRLFDPRRGRLDVLVRVMARSRALDALRRQAAARAAGEGLRRELTTLVPSAGADPVETATSRDRSRRLLTALDHLRPEQRQAVLGSHVAGYTAAELSVATDVPLGTVKSRIRAGLRGLERAAA